ncbi:MAG: restriction endonuclease subunit S [Vibrio anguillarum]
MSSIPQGWSTVLLGDYIDVIRGASPRPKGDPRYFGGDIPWISIRDVNAEKGKYLSQTAEFVTEEGAAKSRYLEEGTLILSNSGSVCIPKILSVKGCIHDGFLAFPTLERHFNKYYFYYLFDWMRPHVIHQNRQGVTQVNLNTGIVKAFQLPIAPLAEQKRIVAKLDEVLAQVDTIKARLDRIPAILKRFRQSVLAAAVSGKLTEEWRERKQIQEAWREVTLKDLTLSISDGDHQAPPKAESGVPFLVISNVSSGFIDFQKITRWVPKEYFGSLKDVRVPKKGDLLYTVTGSFGIPVKVDTDTNFCFQRHIAIIKVHREIVSRDFLYYWLLSPIAFMQAESTATGTAQKTVSLTSLRNFDFNLPRLEEQKEIVRLVDQYFAFADTIEAQVKKAQARVDNLTQSILAKAFRGELVAQDLNDEPADKLLERIAQARTEAEQLAKASKRVKTRA